MKKIVQQPQSKDYAFPNIAYIGCVSVKISDKKVHHACLTRIFNNLDVLRRYVLFVIDDFSKTMDDVILTYDGYFIKAKLDRLFPLKRSHWSNKVLEIPNFPQKSRNDVNILKYWEISEVFVTPDGEIDGVEFYSFSISLFKNTSDKDIDLFIKNSKQVVDIRAKNAAFYSLSKPIKIDWLDGGKSVNDIKIIEEYIN